MLGVYGQWAGDLPGGTRFPSLPRGCTIHSRVSEHRRHYHEVIIIHNHAVAEPDAGATWGYSQVLEGDGRADDNLKRGRFGRERKGGGRSEGRAALPRPCYIPECRDRCYLIFTPGAADTLPVPQGSWVPKNEADSSQ